jgi:hypothetical protein
MWLLHATKRSLILGVLLSLLRLSVLGLILVRFMVDFARSYHPTLSKAAISEGVIGISLSSILGACITQYILSDMKTIKGIFTRSEIKSVQKTFLCRRKLILSLSITAAFALSLSTLPFILLYSNPDKYPNINKDLNKMRFNQINRLKT